MQNNKPVIVIVTDPSFCIGVHMDIPINNIHNIIKQFGTDCKYVYGFNKRINDQVEHIAEAYKVPKENLILVVQKNDFRIYPSDFLNIIHYDPTNIYIFTDRTSNFCAPLIQECKKRKINGMTINSNGIKRDILDPESGSPKYFISKERN